MPRALVHFLHNPMPPRSGAHRRCLRMLAGLREAGYDVTLASSTLHSETPWTDAAVDNLKAAGVRQVEVFEPGLLHRRLDGIEFRARRWLGIQPRGPAAAVHCPLSMKLWFRRLAGRIDPDMLLINYCWFDQLVPCRLAARHVIETHDMISVNRALRQRVDALLTAHEQGEPCDELFDERLMEKLRPELDDEEAAIYDRYDDTIAISPAEAALLRGRLRSSRVRLVAVSDEPRWIANAYDGPVVLTAGPNPFNIQACLYFARKVWPLVRAAVPDATAVILGNTRLPRGVSAPGLEVRGFVEDLTAVYAAAPLAVSAVFVGTGEQIKVVEAMAHGVPVVALRTNTLSRMMENGATGYIAANGEEMAARIVQLLRDRASCARLGAEGRRRVADDAVANRGLPALFDA